MSRLLKAATRGSTLARWQTNFVAGLLSTVSDATVEPLVVQTTGDQRTDVPIHVIGGKGVFVKEVQAAVLDGRASFAVHSAKDLPSITPDGLIFACVPARADARDMLIGATLDTLRSGAIVATGSVRRRAQLAHLRPDIEFAELRGNIGTRLMKADDFDAIVMAAAAIDRLHQDIAVAERLAPEVMLPQVGQGALAIECRADDHETRALLRLIQNHEAHRCVEAERGFLRELGGDCDLPAGAYATLAATDDAHIDDAPLEITAMLAASDGSVLHRASRSVRAADGPDTGAALARHLRDDLGGAALLVR